MGSSKAFRRPDEGADTVIGFVLVTGISLVMISVVMLMGAPALEQVQSRQQVDSMVSSYQRLDRGVSTLLSGAPAGTTPSWQVSMAAGSLSLNEGGEHVWGVVANRHQEGGDYRFWFGEYADGDGEIVVENDGEDVSQFELTATRWDTDSEEEDETSATTTLNSGNTFRFGDDVTEDLWNLAGNATQFRLRDTSNEPGNRTVAHAWFIDAGAVDWTLSRSDQIRLLYQNTAILADIDDGQVLHNMPRLRSPDTDGSEDSVFVRVVNLNGTIAVGGRSTSDILLSSEGNHGRISTSNATEVQIYPPTSMHDAWERHLKDDDVGLGYSWMDDASRPFVGEESAAFFQTSEDEMTATLVETTVQMRRSGGT